ncbi:MAG: flagellar assembly protein FliO, partial [Pseudomonas sp. 34-62-33]
MARLLALLLALPGFALAAEPADKAATPMAGSDV